MKDYIDSRIASQFSDIDNVSRDFDEGFWKGFDSGFEWGFFRGQSRIWQSVCDLLELSHASLPKETLKEFFREESEIDFVEAFRSIAPRDAIVIINILKNREQEKVEDKES